METSLFRRVIFGEIVENKDQQAFDDWMKKHDGSPSILHCKNFRSTISPSSSLYALVQEELVKAEQENRKGKPRTSYALGNQYTRKPGDRHRFRENGNDVLFTEADDDPPDIPDVQSDDTGDNEEPPDVPDMGFDDTGGGSEGNEGDFGDFGDDNDSTNEEEEEPIVSEKISLIMNHQLYQRFLTLLNTVQNQLTSMKGNNDVIYAMSPKALEQVEPLSRLAENIRLYLSNNFLETNYSKNLLFYNRCLNLLNILNKIFSAELRAGKNEEE